ncbi:MAG TPA: TIGR02281 family clan AA aspartic protease [Microvirga sp.]|jgi:aspartyl protease family protein|nr:TIGR02281 family clan AA aspartic protease [Microvirga sp.]
MSGAFGLGLGALAAAGLVHLFGSRPVAGLEPDEFTLLAAFCGGVLLATHFALDGFRRHWTAGIWGLVVWGLIAAGAVGVYMRRGDIAVAFDRLIGEVSAGRTVVTEGGEVVVARRADGSFTLNGRVNERDARFIFDTGASTVVLTAESAAAAGLHPASLNYSVPVSTANGRTLAASVVLDAVGVGSITERRVQALVAKPGALHENLLGMTFLDRLDSYEVRRNRLILRPRGTARS